MGAGEIDGSPSVLVTEARPTKPASTQQEVTMGTLFKILGGTFTIVLGVVLILVSLAPFFILFHFITKYW